MAITWLMRSHLPVEEFENWVKIAEPLIKISKNDSVKFDFKISQGAARLEYGQYDIGMALLLDGKKEGEENLDSQAVTWIDYMIGRHYFNQGEKEISLEYIKESINMMPADSPPLRRASRYMVYGVLCVENDRIDEGIQNQLIGLEIKRVNNLWNHVTVSLNNLAEVYLKVGDTTKSMEYIDRSLVLSDSVQDLDALMFASFLKGKTLQHQGYLKSSLPFLENAMEWWESKNRLTDLPRVYERILITYKGLGKKNETIETLEKFLDIKDTLFNSAKTEGAKNIEAKYDSEKKELELLKEKREREWAEKETSLTKKTERQNFIIFIIISLFLIISIIYLYIRFKNQRRDKNTILNQKLLIEVRSKEIEDSIIYAKRLQSAIMPTIEVVENSFKSAFVLYTPKDIVAGDFYWMDQVDDTILIAAADCTGHGVPGAMVSVVCTNGLNSAVRQHGLIEPNKILDKTREIVVGQFAKSGENVKDGMDISLCSIKNKTLKFSGANNPLWLVRKTEHVSEEVQQTKGNLVGEGYTLIQTKGDKQPIGLSDHESPFNQVEMELLEGDIVYLLTDGYADQFGGISEGVLNVGGKKFKYSRMKKLLLDNCQLPFDQQHANLKQTFDAWQGDLEQLDDVCIIGFSI
jgi:serine phosphatase RsbU (regulator of sigma subunit)